MYMAELRSMMVLLSLRFSMNSFKSEVILRIPCKHKLDLSSGITAIALSLPEIEDDNPFCRKKAQKV